MICAKCHLREATVHFNIVDGDKFTKRDLCEECSSTVIGAPEGFELGDLVGLLQSDNLTYGTLVRELLGAKARYPIEAYDFVGEAARWGQGETPVVGRELLEALRELAIRKFGRRAKATLAEWKIFRTEDLGEIVFGMCDAGLMAMQPGDSREDFKNRFDFDEAFPEG